MQLVDAAPTQDSTPVRYLHLCADLRMLCWPLAMAASRTSPAVHYTHHLAHAACICQLTTDEADSVDGGAGVGGDDFGGGDGGGGSPEAAGANDGFLKMLTEAIDGWILPGNPG